jgi:flagellar motility protein MotE (MotC chaperone)
MAAIAALLLVFDLSRSLHAPSEDKDSRILLQTPHPLVPASVPLNAAEPSAGSELTSSEGTAPMSAQPSAATLRWLPEVPETAAELDDVARDLTRRREEIQELEATLALREAAVRAAEEELKSQITRLEAYQREIKKLLGAADAAREEQIDQLVKVYESMRAKSAAAIFDQLDLPIILSVAKRMREVRMAAILAAMDPDRARLVTTELARARALPRLD